MNNTTKTSTNEAVRDFWVDIDAACDIADDLTCVASYDTLHRYANDMSGAVSLDCLRSLIAVRMGPITDAEWDTACDLIADRFAD